MSSFVSSHHKEVSPVELKRAALENQEGLLSANGALCVKTGARTGRSPKDRFIVKDEITADSVDWGKINQPIEPAVFSQLWDKAEHHMQDREAYVANLQVGAHLEYGIAVEVVTEYAWHNLFAQNLFIRPEGRQASVNPVWKILNTPSLKTVPKEDHVNSDGVVIINFTERKVLLVGMRYAGEMKKAMFTVLNYLLPAQDVLPMHCAANVGKAGDTALFFGLSGTGKTTLSADPARFLIGDDEHGWSKSQVFNFEGGCYAKCIALSEEREPVIWKAIKDGAVMENVVLNSNNEPDFNDTSLTENTRVAYPREHIEARVNSNCGEVPTAVVFLTCDLYGVLPPVALLTKQQAAYYFLSGYTALVGSTEVGSSAGISATFSTCFGAPFFPRKPELYAELLMKRIDESGAQVYLVNTGWTGGAYSAGGRRFDIPTTRAVITAIVSGNLTEQPTVILPGLNLAIPETVAGVDSILLNPKNAWSDVDAYDVTARKLIQEFQKNFNRFSVPEEIRSSGPQLA